MQRRRFAAEDSKGVREEAAATAPRFTETPAASDALCASRCFARQRARFGKCAFVSGYDLRVRSSTFVRKRFKSEVDYVTRRFDASSAELRSSWGCIFAETPLNAISRSNWSPESAEVRRTSWTRLVRMVPGFRVGLEQNRKALTITLNTYQKASLALFCGAAIFITATVASP
jgi:hypothetical protein